MGKGETLNPPPTRLRAHWGERAFDPSKDDNVAADHPTNPGRGNIYNCTCQHRWESPVSLLPQNQGKLPIPLFGVIIWIVLYDCIRQNYHKNSQIVTIFPHYGKLPYFFFKLPHFMFSENCTKFSLSSKNTLTIYQNG